MLNFQPQPQQPSLFLRGVRDTGVRLSITSSLVIRLYHDLIMLISPSKSCDSTLSWYYFSWWYHHPTGDDVWRLSTISIIMTVAGHPPRADDWWTTKLAADWREEGSIREEGEWQHYFIINWFMMTRILLFLPLKKITLDEIDAN